MPSQIFKNNISKEMLFNLLDSICIKDFKSYIFNLDAFKKGVYNEEIPKFIELSKSYYYISKRHYLEKKLTYNSFTTIIRQICKSNDIHYSSKIKYEKSDYNIIYYIYFE
jgi:hypothetical protein